MGLLVCVAMALGVGCTRVSSQPTPPPEASAQVAAGGTPASVRSDVKESGSATPTPTPTVAASARIDWLVDLAAGTKRQLTGEAVGESRGRLGLWVRVGASLELQALDGAVLERVDAREIAESEDGAIRILDGSLVVSTNGQFPPRRVPGLLVRVSPRGDSVAYVTRDPWRVHLLDLRSGASKAVSSPVQGCGCDGGWPIFLWSPSGRYLVIADWREQAVDPGHRVATMLADVDSGSIKEVGESRGGYSWMTWERGRDVLAFADGSGVRVMSLAANESFLLPESAVPPYSIVSIRFDPNGELSYGVDPPYPSSAPRDIRVRVDLQSQREVARGPGVPSGRSYLLRDGRLVSVGFGSRDCSELAIRVENVAAPRCASGGGSEWAAADGVLLIARNDGDSRLDHRGVVTALDVVSGSEREVFSFPLGSFQSPVVASLAGTHAFIATATYPESGWDFQRSGR